MTAVVLEKVKQPGERVFTFQMRALASDGHGEWFLLPAGSPWTAPHDAGTLPFDVVLLLATARPWVAWWAPHPGDERLEVDVCLPPERSARGWRFVDLELDVFQRRGSELVTVEDRDEFDDAVRAGAIGEGVARLAEKTARDLERRLTACEESWVARGWELLDAAVDPSPSGSSGSPAAG